LRTTATGPPADPRNPQIFTESRVTARNPRCYWDYTDVCAFLICVVMLGALVRLAVVFHLLSASTVQQPTVLFQAVVSVCSLLALHATLKFRHGGAVWQALGWTLPSCRYVLAASLGGVLLAGAVTLVAQSSSIPTPSVTAWKIAVLAATVGPILEESFFRGCLLPLIERTSGPRAAVILTALLFAFFHQPPTVLHCACFAVSGIVYGWVRVASRSTTAAALMHATYNLTLFACQSW
jgi:membrane protease YdiL (CAAX protease family)